MRAAVIPRQSTWARNKSPISKLTPQQAEYYFLSGFTAKLAGTERGITEPTPTFSACFGAAFLSFHPAPYAEVLAKRMQAVNATGYLVNTGWNGTGNRISMRDTRAIIDAILSGELDSSETARIPYFNLAIPSTLHHVTSSILDPRSTYQDVGQWDATAKNLAQMFVGNFTRFTDTESGKALIAAGPEI